MKMLRHVPRGLQEINDFYGNWEDSSFVQDHLTWKRMPFKMRLSWNQAVSITGFMVHLEIAEVVYDVLKQILNFGGLPFLRDNNLDFYGGCYNPRGKVGGGGTSVHAWGIGIDWCPALGAYGQTPNMPAFIVEAFTSRGFEWGGTWKKPDGMHFQACTSY